MAKQKNDKKNFQKGIKGSGTALKVSKVNDVTFNSHHKNQGSDNKKKQLALEKKNSEFDEKMKNLRERNMKHSAPKKIVKIQAPTFVLPSQGVQKEEVVNIGSVALDDMFIDNMRKESLTPSYNAIGNDSTTANSSLYVGMIPKMKTNPNIFDVLSIDDDSAARLQLLQKATFTFESTQSLLFSNNNNDES